MIIVAIVCLIIFKNEFWENRYLVLLIGSVVAFVAILSTNFSVKNNLETKVVTNWSKPIQIMNLTDYLFVSDSATVAKITLDLKNYFCEDSTSRTILTTNQIIVGSDTIYQTDTIVASNIKHSNYFIYTHNEKLKVVYTEDGGDVDYYYLADLYIIPSESDTVAYIIKKTKYYDPNTKWVAGLSLPKIETIKCLCIPPTEYNKIPKSYLKDVPF
jgi:hypothetical protein